MSRIELGPGEIRRASWFGLKPVMARLLGARAVNPMVQMVAKVLPASVGHRLPLNKRSIIYRLDSGSSIQLLDPLHDIVARDIYWGGEKAGDSAERHKLACLEQLSKSVDLFIDVGAYAGFCSLIAARSNPRLRAIAYEIVPENYLLLARNVIENNFVSQIEPRLRGLGAKPGFLTLPERFGAASYQTSISLGSRFGTGVSIPIVPLDEDIDPGDRRLLIKIDVEGFEDQVFAGAKGIIESRRPDILCEILPGTAKSAETITRNLSALGYKWFCFEEHGPQARDRVEPGQVMRDWLFTVDPSAAGCLQK
jgi:FkbM family methyltransferase